MKVAIYIEQGVTQLVLTPESEWERDVCKKVTPDGQHTLTIRRGEFYACMGGWFRQGNAEDSLILRVDRTPLPSEPTNE